MLRKARGDKRLPRQQRGASHAHHRPDDGGRLGPPDGVDEGEDRVAASYRGNYDRLAQVKARYDPTNLFRMNQNIKANGA